MQLRPGEAKSQVIFLFFLRSVGRRLGFFGLMLAVYGQMSAATVTGYARLIQSTDSAVKKKNDFSGVVVWLESPQDALTHAVRKHAQMTQKDKRFWPHILPIETGTSVDFPNLDPMFHNAFSNYDGQIFDVALYPPGSSRTVRFDKPGIVRVFCNIHPSMSAIIVVVDSNYFATTDAKGRYVLPHVSPGKYVLHFFHERATPEVLAQLSQTIMVGSEDEHQEIAMTTISEAGYLPVAHKNKYGRDYPADADKVDGYSVHLK
ncbi:MAG TPA: carboxypeptidase regulatory-like domain-containing protein [Bryobacteraceae bacterium]|nr:carboxypeptidase regulatory-like domain-containing protein [Bryobacteraceae bacterium]